MKYVVFSKNEYTISYWAGFDKGFGSIRKAMRLSKSEAESLLPQISNWIAAKEMLNPPGRLRRTPKYSVPEIKPWKK